jgi:enoyl-CoA hydratase/carnithine racemase
MAYETIDVAADGALGRLMLNRPDSLNPLGETTLAEVIEAAGWFDAQRGVKVVVVGGNGRAFSAGADLAAFAGGDRGRDAQRNGADLGRRMADAVSAMRAVTVARIHGHCVGGAVVLAAACDLRVATATTRFAIPEVALGIPLAWGGIPRLVREIGPALTRELVMTCRPFDGVEAHAIGFVNRVVDDDALDDAVDDLVGQLVDKSAFTLEATKRSVNAALDAMASTADALQDAELLVRALHDPDSRAVGRAYLARRRESGRG